MQYFLIIISYIGLFLTIFWLQVLYRTSELTPHKKYIPTVSIVIPVHNEATTIAKTLKSAFTSRYPKNKLEVIVVNDGSTDATRTIVEQFARVKLINQKQKGKAAALNTGMKYCKGELFVCLDADSYVAPNALHRLTPYFVDLNIGGVICAIKINEPKTFVQKLQWFEYILSAFARKLMAKINVLYMTPGAFSVYRTSILRKLKGFSVGNLTEDFEMALRLHKHHYTIKINTASISYTTAPETLFKLFNQRVRWYRGFISNTLSYRSLFFNSAYGMLGSFQLPIAVITMFLSVFIVGIFVARLFKQLYLFFGDLFTMGLDYFRLYQLPTISTFLKLDVFLGYPILLGIALTLFMFFLAHKNLREKFKYKFTFVAYFFYFGLIHVISFLTAAVKETFNAKRKW